MDEVETVIAELEEEKAEIEAVIGILRRRQARKAEQYQLPVEEPEPPLRVIRAPAAPIFEEDPDPEQIPAAASAGGRPGLAARTKRGPGRPPIPRG